MKNIIFILSVVFTFYSCNPSKDEKQNIQMMNPNDIQISEVVHDSLTKEQIDKIKIIQSTFAEVYPVSLEESIANFKRDQNPNSEITIWLQMADTYKKYVSSKEEKLDLNTKKEVFKLILSRSMMSDDEAIINSKLTVLTENEAKKVLSYYTVSPYPIDIVKKP